ncbi:hypothetical protein J5N97_009903 [Dioscorea zingiberensis]|uniref:Uncharacterized protein n=1 Tax=Dioscorea zingiberensis TaxID=325984 RepID=A0A9D5HMA2_9LILI|nr:hypothetical protein J5N97_009903 [Dioscorea zingiberensis]
MTSVGGFGREGGGDGGPMRRNLMIMLTTWMTLSRHGKGFESLRHLIKVEIRPDLILGAEKELGIVTGLQDRVAQVYGGLVYMVLYFQDFSKECLDKLGYGMYTPMDINLLPPLHLIYAENPSDSGMVCLP